MSLKILAVDISGVFSQMWEVDNGRGRDFDKPRTATIEAIRRFRDGHDRVAICCDSGKSFRTQLWESYKAGRPDRGEAYRSQLGQTIEALEAEGCSVFRSPKYNGDLYAEADDVIGSLCSWAFESGHSVTILSSDKDMLQLVSDHVSMLRPIDKEHKLYDAAAVMEKYGIPPHKIPDFLALAGDSCDGYKPYQGIGDKSAVALLAKYGHALGVFDGVVSMPELSVLLGAKRAESLVSAGPEPARRALQVATIVRDLPLDFERLTGEPVRPVIPPQEQTPLDRDQIEPQAVEQTQTAQPAQRALAVAAPQQLAPQLQPGAYWVVPGFVSETWRLATAFYQAQLFPQYANAQQIMTIMLMAYEDGIGVATALQHAYPVHGRLSHSATYLLMRAEASGTVEVFDVVTSTDRECVIKCKRRGRAECVVKFTVDDAERAGLIKPGSNWKKWPIEMLLARCMTRALRQVWRDKVGGRYTPEELEVELPEEAIVSAAREARRALAEKHAA